ncbi:MAG TPA: phosphoadenosine phosphosulfate reductase family protein [Tepidisphaeraceae bacterium]|nr:phosphoadenosine phosphosulfate reductase family protein [Tepidisphaeraceae bacterium]
MNVPPTIREMIDGGALFVLNDSGGKDSQAMRLALRDIVPAEQKVVIHASLGDVEWPGALEHARAGAEREGMPFMVATAVKTFFQMVEHRFTVRPGPNSPCWPSAANRQCTSDLKRGPIEREIRRLLAARGLSRVVTCMGIRAQESPKRAKIQPLRRSERNSVAGRDWWEWLPIHDMSRNEVFASIKAAGEQPHWAYAAGNERLSCMFCIMGSRNDLANAARHNPQLFARYVEVEERTGYTMHQSRVPLRVLAGGAA